MRLSKGYIVISVAAVLIVLIAVLWYVRVIDDTKTQDVLHQAAQDFLEEQQPADAPKVKVPSAAEVWAAHEQRAAGIDAPLPTAIVPEPPRRVAPTNPPEARAARSSVPASGQSTPVLSTALLLTALTALGLAGSTYRLAKQEGRIRLERDQLARELDLVRSNNAPPAGRPAPPWQDAALVMVRSSSVPAIAYDLDARVLEVSEAFTRITGYTRVDIPDVKAWFTKVLRTPEAELEAALESFRTKVHGGQIEPQTVWTRDGAARTWLCQPLEVWPLEGDALLLVARATDVTDEVEAARQAQAEAASLRAALEEANRRIEEGPGQPAAEADTELRQTLAQREQENRRLAEELRRLRESATIHPGGSSARETELAELLGRREEENRQLAHGLQAARDKLAAIETEASAREAELSARLARRDQECEELLAQSQTLKDKLAAEQAQVEALRAAEGELARRVQVLENERDQVTRQLESAYRSAGAGLCLVDRDLRTLQANPRWREMAREAGGDERVFSVLGPVAREALGGGTRIAVLHLRNGVAEERTWRIECQPIAPAANAPAEVLGVTAVDVTEDTQRLNTLKEEVERLRLFAEHFEDGMWLADPRIPRLLYANPQAAKLRGRPLERMLEDFSEWTAAVHEADRERVREAFLAAAVEGSYNVEYRVAREDGSVAWLHDRGVAVRDSHGRLRCIAGMTSDVTLRRNADDMMRATVATLRTIVEHAPAMIWLKDAEGRYLHANREYGKLTGFAPEQLRGRTDDQVFPRAVAERMHEHDARAMAVIGVHQSEETLQLSDGPHHYLMVRFPVRNAYEPAAALCGMALEMTGRRRSEDALRSEASRYRAIAASLPEPLLIVRENRVVYANSAAAELFAARDADALVGMPLAELAAESPGVAEAARMLATEEGGRRRFPAILKARDGRKLEVELSVSAYDTATERAVLFVVHDVAERNARIRALEESKRFLQQLCEQAPAALRLVAPDGRCTFATPRWQALTGQPATGDWLEQVHPDDRDAVARHYATPPRRGELRAIEYRVRSNGAQERWILETLATHDDGSASSGSVLASAIDISERKRSEQALRAHRDELAAWLERCPAPVWVAAADGKGYANQACRDWLGAEHAGDDGLDLDPYVHPDDRNAWRLARERHAEDGAPIEGEFRLRRGDGEYREVRLAAVPVDGRLIGILDDVTAWRRTERALDVAEQRQAQVVRLIGSTGPDPLAQVRSTAEMVRVMFPSDPKLQQTSARVLTETQRLQGMLDEMLEPVRARI